MAMDIFRGCICENCGSVMFVSSWGDISKAEFIFVCPRGCRLTKIQGILNKMTSKQARDIMLSLDPKAKYHNICWNCKEMVDSKHCVRDSIPTLGFICSHCGRSLRQLFTKLGIITTHPINVPANLIEIKIELPLIIPVF